MPLSPRTLRPSSTFTPKSISGLALWLDGSDTNSLYTTDAGAVTAVSSPTEISGCVGWWDASDASSITESGGLVSQWNDKSGSARHATATTTARPTTGTRTVGGRNALDFNGTSNVMTLGGTVIPTAATHTVFLVYQLDTASQSRFSTLLSSSPAGDQEMRVVGFGSTAIDFYFNGNLGRFLTTTALGLGPVVFSAREATKSVRSAGAGVFSTGSGDAYAWASNPITLGGRPSSNWMDGLLCEAIIFSSTLSDADTSRVEAYLAQRWGISGVHVPATATSDPVGAWLDKSGNGRHVTQSTAASRPTISATALNGRRQLGLVSQHLRGPSTTWTGSVSIYWVGKTGQSANGAIVFGDGTVDQTDGFHAGWLNTQGVGAYGNGWGAGNAPRAESPSAWRNADIVAGVTLSSTESVARVNGATTNTTAALTGLLSQSAAAQFYIGRETNNTWNNISGTLAELLIYQPALNASQRLRVERHLAAKYGITLAPQVSNADAQDWVNRVYANGGTVSASTAAAVNQFCNDIENAPGGSLRDRFYRLNLFCGTGLNACLVPLYRGPSIGGTQYGNTTDTNNGPFVSGDYAETGASGGLTGNGSTKYLNTGLAPANLPDFSTGHLSVYAATGFGGSTIYALLSSLGAGYAENYSIEANRTSAGALYGAWGKGGTFSTLATAAQGAGNGHTLIARTSSTDLSAYRNTSGSAIVTSSTSVTPATSSSQWHVFAHGTGGTPLNYAAARLGGYSIGASMTGAQAAAFYTAMQAFQTALGRNV